MNYKQSLKESEKDYDMLFGKEGKRKGIVIKKPGMKWL